MLQLTENYPGSRPFEQIIRLNPAGTLSRVLIEGCGKLAYDPFFARGIFGWSSAPEPTNKIEDLLSKAQENWDAAKRGEYGTFSNALILALQAVDEARDQQAEDGWADIMRKVESEKNLPT